MLHYLFTNDLRHEAWPTILVDTATLIHEDKVPSAAQNKSKNNYICTQASYLCIQKGTRANEYCRNGKVNPVVLNFINRFQFPNARTKESYDQSVGDRMSIAPLRVAVQLLFALRLVDRAQSRLSYDELVKYIVCNQKLAVGSETNLLILANQIVKDRAQGITPPHLDSNGLAEMGVEWKHCPRQVKELFSLLEFAPFIKSTAVDLRLEIPESIDAGAAKQFFYIVNNRELWHAPQATDWSTVQQSYQEYMEAGLAQFEVDVEPSPKTSSLPESNVDCLTIALKLFREARNSPTSTSVRCWVFSPGEQACRWDEMRDGGVMALSYSECGRDLREYADEEAIRAEFKSSVEDDASHKNDVRALTDFLNVMKPGDIVFAKKGTKTFLGVGRVTGEYEFAADAPDYKHRRAVEWLKVETVEREDAVARKTLTDVTRYGDLVRELCESYGIEVESKYDEYARKTRAMFSDVDGAKLNSIDWSEFCSTHFSGSQVSAHFRSYDSASKTALGDWLKDARENAQDIVHEFDRAPKLEGLKSFGTTICMFLMKANPKSFCSFAEQGFKSLVFLGLETEKTFPEVSVESYYHNKELQTQVLTAMAKLGIKNEADGASDYLTVNEFLWFVSENEDLIKEKVMSTKQKKVSNECKGGTKQLKSVLGDNPDSMMSRLTAALLTKPFAILAGASGTGKSRMVRKLAYMTCNAVDLQNEAKGATAPGNFKMIQVKPNWHDSSELLGYRKAIGEGYHSTDFVKFVLKAHAYPTTPFFVCLDEMNLAPVEQYFAEYLSACESIKKGDDKDLISDPLIPASEYDGDISNLEPEYELSQESKNLLAKNGLFIPKNLFVVGTVNMDDTTCGFSRKVLDRAMTIEMNEVNFGELKESHELKLDDLLLDGTEINYFVERPQFEGGLLDDEVEKKLADIQGKLEGSPFAIAYRFAKESVLYREALKKILTAKDDGELVNITMDHMSLMKILPRITGTLTERETIIKNLKEFFGTLGDRKLSSNTLDKMVARAKSNGDYISFWP